MYFKFNFFFFDSKFKDNLVLLLGIDIGNFILVWNLSDWYFEISRKGVIKIRERKLI